MNIKIFLLLLGILASPLSAEASCQLPAGEKIRIGCTTKCDFFYRLRLKLTARYLGYKTEISNLSGQDITSALKSVDGVLLPGGADIHPKYYWNKVTPELKDYTQENLHLAKLTKEAQRRDPFEYELVRKYSADESFKDLPMLGICRGLQMMSVAQGLPLYLDIKTELGIKNRKNRFDRISITEENSLMSSMYGEHTRGYKIHHQGIRVSYYEDHAQDYPLVKLTSFSNKSKIAESIEYTHRPALGVQYHPERSTTRTSAPVFRWFLQKACEYKNSVSKDLE